MLIIDRLSRSPVYEQIIEQFKNLIAVGQLQPGGVLPSVRSLSQELSINPNTLQKAYSEMEHQGLCITAPGSGRYITPNAKELIFEMRKKRLGELESLLYELAAAGISKEEIINSVKAIYKNTAVAGEEGLEND